MRRREFLLGSVGAGGALAAATESDAWASGALAQEETPADDGNGEEHVVMAGTDDEPFAFDPDELEIAPGDTVTWRWGTDTHNVTPTSQPEEADWPGHPGIENAGYEYSYTFEVEGTYEYECIPHADLGMTGTIIVGEADDAGPVAPGQPGELDPHEIGVPLQKHFIGIATFFAIGLTLVFTFYVLKYGESPHSGSPHRK